MPLPELKTSKEIKDQIITDIESQIGQNTPILYKAFNRVLAGSLALTMTVLYKLGDWGYKQIFTATQGTVSLKRKQEQYGIPSKNAQATKLQAGATGASAVTIPAGQTYRGDVNGLVYVVDTSVELSAGVATLDLTCLTTGEAGNLLAGDTLTILSPISGVDNAITVTVITVEGEDAETIEELRARVSAREKLPPQGGSTYDYINWALEVEGVTRAFVYGHRDVAGITEGHVNIYPLVDGETERIPTAPKLAEVLAHIDAPTRAPVQVVDLDVLAMASDEYEVTIDDLIPNNADVKNAIDTNIGAWLLERQPQQFSDQTEDKSKVSRALLEGVAVDSGATSLTLTVKRNTVPIETYTLLYNELAELDQVIYI
jgi:uncharacterized phage protein gp47/JayE